MSKPIWFDVLPIDDPHYNIGLTKHLGIELIEAGPDFLRGRMPVDERTKQPYGLLHGGASVVLAETLASVASAATVDRSKQTVVGLEINANHLRAVREGWVVGTARPVTLGRTIHVWDVRLTDQQDRPICISRCTVMILDKRPGLPDADKARRSES